MIIDTLVVVVCLMAGTPHTQRVEPIPVNRFAKQFQHADSLINAACERAARSAQEKTKREKEKLLDFSNIRAIIEELERNTVKR